MKKGKLSIEDQILHMENVKGIKFNIVNGAEAKLFLTNNNYYFKLKSYAKNFDKYINGPNVGKYINLEFAYLQELSTLDMHLRKLIIKMTLDIEHSLKTQLLRDAAINPLEDGYKIVNEFFALCPDVSDNIKIKAKSSVCCDLIIKYGNDFAVWNIVEVLSFGDFIKLYEIYYRRYPSKESLENCLWSVKFIRNTAAHNNCMLNSLKKPYTNRIRANKEVNTYISKINGIGKKMRQNKMQNPLVHDFIVSLYVFNNIIKSEPMKLKTMVEIKQLFDIRFTRNKNYFSKNDIIISHYKFVKLVIDHLYNKAYNVSTEQKH